MKLTEGDVFEWLGENGRVQVWTAPDGSTYFHGKVFAEDDRGVEVGGVTVSK